MMVTKVLNLFHISKEVKEMKNHLFSSCVGLALLIVVAFFGTASAVTITFSEYPVGTLVDNQYAGLGVVFSVGPVDGTLPIIANDGAMPGSPVLSPNPPYNGDFWMTFTSPTNYVQFEAGYWDTVSTGLINVYDPFATLLFTATNIGTGPETFTFQGLGNIGAIYFNSENDPAGADIDNLTFYAVPEPSTLLLLGSGFAGLGLWGRKRFKANS
jgi:hypothetical protein